MHTYKFCDVVLLEFPFSDGINIKQRPALVLMETNDNDILVARITSQNKETEFDIEITNWELAGLKLPSIVRIHKVATLEKAIIKRKLGTLDPLDKEIVKQTIEKLWLNLDNI